MFLNRAGNGKGDLQPESGASRRRISGHGRGGARPHGLGRVRAREGVRCRPRAEPRLRPHCPGGERSARTLGARAAQAGAGREGEPRVPGRRDPESRASAPPAPVVASADYEEERGHRSPRVPRPAPRGRRETFPARRGHNGRRLRGPEGPPHCAPQGKKVMENSDGSCMIEAM